MKLFIIISPSLYGHRQWGHTSPTYSCSCQYFVYRSVLVASEAKVLTSTISSSSFKNRLHNWRSVEDRWWEVGRIWGDEKGFHNRRGVLSSGQHKHRELFCFIGGELHWSARHVSLLWWRSAISATEKHVPSYLWCLLPENPWSLFQFEDDVVINGRMWLTSNRSSFHRSSTVFQLAMIVLDYVLWWGVITLNFFQLIESLF